MALLSRSLSNGLISGSSANISKADLYAHGAVNQIVGDLKLEIIAGSTVAAVTPPNSGASSIASPYQASSDPVAGTIYRPSAVNNAVPANAGPSSYTSAIWNLFANLVKESARSVPFYPSTGYDSSYGSAPSRAAPVNSATSPSRNGRVVSLVSWNEPLLLPNKSVSFSTSATTGTTISDTGTDPTPNSSFVAPDWILTAADGSNPITWPANAVATIANPKNSSYVTGRYAYAIYNEGGLLNANVAGSPAPNSSLSATQQLIWSRKGPQSFADLTEVPGISNLTSAQQQSFINALVGWRNYATLQAAGSFPTYTFGNIGNYFTSILGLPTRFMTTGNPSSYAGQNDRLFTSRQQLIAFFQDFAQGNSAQRPYVQDALMYFTHFSRALNQPSFWPDPQRPTVQGPVPAGTTTVLGNSAYQNDNVYNPPFKSIRAATAFTRNDGTAAVIGEPLVKKRFALSRLCWLTYKGPSATLLSTSPSDSLLLYYSAHPELGVSTQLLGEGTSTNILNYFGLTWNAGSGSGGQGGYWVYSHGISNIIGQLYSLPTTQQREPDFFELLKAGIDVGSIAKSAFGISRGDLAPYVLQTDDAVGGYLAKYNASIDQQILALGVNIIDQVQPDDFPTNIVFTDGTIYHSFWGKKDLPYLAGIMTAGIVYNQAQASSGTLYPGGNAPNETGVTLSSNGRGVALQVPMLWNPHTYISNSPSVQNSSLSNSLSPTNLRLTVSTVALDASSTSASSLPYEFTINDGSTVQQGGFIVAPWALGSFNSATGYVTSPSTGSPNTSLLFNNIGTLYREPTPLMRPGIPSGSGLAIDGNNAIVTAAQGLGLGSSWSSGIPEANTNIPYIGFYMGSYPISTTDSSLMTHTVNYFVLYHSKHGVTYSLEYQSQGVWIPYQQYSLDPPFSGFAAIPHFMTTGSTVQTEPELTSWPTISSSAPSTVNQGNGNQNVVFDPRTMRWGTPENLNLQPFLDSSAAGYTTTSGYTIVQTVRPDTGIGANWSAQHVGATSQNMGQSPGFAGASSIGDFYLDPDGTVRRAMGAYTQISNAAVGGGIANTTVSLPLATVYPTPGTPPVATVATQYNRPIILHRPFRSVAELGYVFTDTPWKNIDFFTPESGFSPLLDVFCINEDYRADAVSAGQVDLNTKQAPVIQAILGGAYRDEMQIAPSMAVSEASAISQALVTRTTGASINQGPLLNVAELVGRYIPGGTYTNPYGQPYDGFSADFFNGGSTGLYTYTAPASTSPYNLIQRFRETSMRALSDAGQAGTWNLMIDLVAQSGHYPIDASGLADFLVEGERHYWVHIAIDRQTGQIIDENIEVVNQ